MRKKIVLFMLMLAAVGASKAQVLSTIEIGPGIPITSGSPVCVDNWELVPTVSVFGMNLSDGRLCFGNINHYGYSVSTPGAMGNYTEESTMITGYEMTVNDLKTNCADVYFCGSYKQYGMIGRYSILDQDTVPVQFYIFNIVDKFTKMVVYDDPNYSNPISRVVAIGEKKVEDSSGTNTDYYILDWNALNPNPFNYSRINDSTHTEKVYEILKVHNYVATIGYSTQYQALSMRLYAPGNVLGAPLKDNLIYFPGSATEVMSRTHSSKISDYTNIIAVSYLSSETLPIKTRIRFIHLHHREMINSQEYSINDIVEPLAITHIDGDSTLIVLHDMTPPNSIIALGTKMIRVKPYENISYYTDVTYKKEVLFHAITKIKDPYTNKDYLTISNKNMWMLRDAVNNTHPHACLTSFAMPIKNVRNMRWVDAQHPMQTLTIVPEKINTVTRYRQEDVVNECYEH